MLHFISCEFLIKDITETCEGEQWSKNETIWVNVGFFF